MNSTRLWVFLVTLFTSNFAAATTLQEILDSAVRNSERIASDKADEKVAEFKTALARSDELPYVAAQATDSTGMAGSTGMLGVGGLMGSPYRSGWGYGVVGTQTLLDFGKTNRNIEAAEADVTATREKTALTRANVLEGALDAFVKCALTTSEIRNWSEINAESRLLAHEVAKYVNTGQRSVAEELLSRGQNDEAARNQAAFEKRLVAEKQRLTVITALPTASIECDPIENLEFTAAPEHGESPLTKAADARYHAAESRLHAARGGYLPKLTALATVGDLQDTRGVKETDYALGVALTIPLFDSGRTNAEVNRASAELEKSAHEKAAARQHEAEATAQYDEQIEAAQSDLDHLKIEVKDAEEAFRQSKKRYMDLKGSLADLRESVRNLSHVKTQAAEDKAVLVHAILAKDLLLGRR